MIASVHIADVGVPSALKVLRKAPRSDAVPGLRHASVGLVAPLSGSVLPRPAPGRAGLVAFWDDDAALDGFLAEHPLAATLGGGWHVRLAPLRASGTWPGLPAEVPATRAVEYDGPVAALTLGRMRATQAVRFFRTSAKAEDAVVVAPGLVWASGIGRPPFVSTCSLWEGTLALSTYAYGHREAAHPDAIKAGEAKPFHHESAFIRFRPYGSQGKLDGKNPLAEQWMARAG